MPILGKHLYTGISAREPHEQDCSHEVVPCEAMSCTIFRILLPDSFLCFFQNCPLLYQSVL